MKKKILVLILLLCLLLTFKTSSDCNDDLIWSIKVTDNGDCNRL